LSDGDTEDENAVVAAFYLEVRCDEAGAGIVPDDLTTQRIDIELYITSPAFQGIAMKPMTSCVTGGVGIGRCIGSLET
jgi:hypothetical protein